MFTPLGRLDPATLPAGNLATYRITNRGDGYGDQDPSAWHFQGSNDGVGWTTLDSRYDDLKTGLVKPIDGEEAFSKLREKSERRRLDR